MKVLLIGVGTVGEAIATVAASRPWLEKMVLADHNLERAHEVRHNLARRPGSRSSRSMPGIQPRSWPWPAGTAST